MDRVRFLYVLFSTLMRWLQYLALPLILFALWAGVSYTGRVPAILLPTPGAVWDSFVSLTVSGDLLHHTLASGFRSLAGFAIASALGLALGLLNVRSAVSTRVSYLLLEAARVTPPLSLIPLLILWLGIDEAPKIAIVFLASFFPIYMNVVTAVKAVDPKLEEAAKLLRFTKSERLRYLTLPSSLPGILTGLRLGFGYSWRALVAAELIAASSGLGFLISDSAEFAKTDTVFVGIITIAVVGVIADRVLYAAFEAVGRRVGRAV